MKNYTYRFNDGTTKVVEVDDELYTVLAEQDRIAKRQQWVAEKHNISLNYLNSKEIDFGKEADNPLTQLIIQEEEQAFEALISSILNPKQMKLYKLLIEGFGVVEIAQIEGVTKGAISQRLKIIREKLKDYFGKT